MFGLQSPKLPGLGETWRKLSKLRFAQRVDAINDPQFSARLVAEANESSIPMVDMKYVFYLGASASPDYRIVPENNLCAIAQAAGEHWSETFLRLSRETRGKALFNYIMHNRSLRALPE